MSLSIYILRLQGGKYYVGKTMNVAKRYQEHVNGHGAQWTRIYKPISLEQTIPNASPFDEDKYVKVYMAKYGIPNVRGGSYVSEELNEIQEEALKREIWGAQNKCTQCGRKGHFVKNCFAKTDVDGYELQSEDDEYVPKVKYTQEEINSNIPVDLNSLGSFPKVKYTQEEINSNKVTNVDTINLVKKSVLQVSEPNKPFSIVSNVHGVVKKLVVKKPEVTPSPTYPVQHKIQFQSSPESLNSTEYEVLPISQEPSKISASHLHSLAVGRHKRDVEEKVRQILNMIYEQASLKLRWTTFVIPPELEKEVLEQLREQFDTSVTFTNKGQLKTSDMRYWWMKYEVSWI